jgi:hypothetical protein
MSDDEELQRTIQPPPEELERLQASPGFKKALELIRNLSEYDDFSSDFLDKFPLNLPSKFRLRLGSAVIGEASVDWKPVAGRLFSLMLTMGKPKELSEDDYYKQLEEYFKTLTEQENQELIMPAISAMWHMMEFLPQKLNDAIISLAIEGRHKNVMRRQKDLGRAIPSPAKFAEQIAKREKSAVQSRLPKLQPTKTKPAWQSTNNLREFAGKVEARVLLCQCMKNMYERCDFDEGWVEDLNQDEQFKLLSAGVLPAAIGWAIRRIGDDSLETREKEETLIACEVARQELDLPYQEIHTLRGYYLDGLKFLQAERKKRKALPAAKLPSAPSTGQVDSADAAPPITQADSTDSE